MTYRTYSSITGNPELSKAIREGRVYREYPDGDYVEVEPEVRTLNLTITRKRIDKVFIEPEEQEKEE